MQIGAQLYTVRNFCQTTEGLSETLKKVADIGYQTVQLSGVCAYDPLWMKEQLAQNGLTCAITHTDPERMIAQPQVVAAEHDLFDCDHIGIGGYDIIHNGIDVFCEKFKPVAEVFTKSGKKLMYHNHYNEFSKLDGSLIMDLLTERFAPEEMGITLDTYWVQYAGADPVQWLYALAGRTPCIHMKDMLFDQKMAPIGEGNMNYDSILTAAVDTDVQVALVEQDESYGKDPFDCLARSYAYLKSFGLE